MEWDSAKEEKFSLGHHVGMGNGGEQSERRKDFAAL